MIQVVAKHLVKADKVEEFIALAKSLVKATNENDKGCISYELFQGTSNPQVLTIIEQWEDKEALQNHMQAKHFKDAMGSFDDFLEEPGEINLYQKLA